MKKDRAVRKKEWKEALLKKLKGFIGPLILLLIILAGVLVIVFWKETPESEEIVKVNAYEGDGGEVILENDNLRLVMDSATTQFRLEVKSTGQVWYSNPDGAAEDPLALTVEKEKLQSTMLLTYSTINGVDTLYNNYTYSMQNGIYDIEQGEDYIKVFYSIGDMEKEYIIPPVILEEKMDELLAAMDSTSALLVMDYYKKYDINNLGRSDNAEELLAQYPILETEVVYALRSTTRDNIKSKLEEYFTAAGYTLEAYAEDKEMDLSVSSSDKPVFNVNVVYRLDGNDMIVEVPMDEIEYKEEYPLLYLSILPYFGAGTAEEEGYMLVPEGGGALISFNNGKVAQNSYYANLYGWDMGQARTAVVHDTRAYFNVFGVAKNDNSFLCIMEEGTSYAAVQADIYGHGNSFNYVNAIYSVTHREQYEVADKYNGEMYVYEPEIPDESLKNRYRFIASDSYVDMAKAYGEYLEDTYQEQFAMVEQDSVPVAVEIVGAVDKVQQVVGIPVSMPLKLTSYQEAQSILQQLQDGGMDNMYVKLTGWMNGGVQQKFLNNVKLISELGSKKDFNNLISYANENGIQIFLDGVTDYAYDSDLLDGFFSAFHAARFVSKEQAELFEYSKITYGQREGQDTYYLLNGTLMLQTARTLVEKTASFQAGVSFQNIGKDLSADYNEDNPQSRQTTLQLQAELLEETKAQGMPIMINMGNDYAIAYADMVTNMDLAGSEYTILDRTVPFYQLAIHGHVNYTGESLNITQNFEEELLNSAEYGAGLSFTLMNETAFALQKTLYTEYFGAAITGWYDKMMEIYNRYNAELGHVFGQEMTNHSWVTDKVACTEYADGTKVYVNYGYQDCVVEGQEIPARDYKAVP